MTRPHDPRRTPAPRRRDRAAGFSVIELLIYVVMFALLMIAMLTIFDSTNELARSQTHIADMQQSLRVAQDEMVRHVRMAGRAPGWNMPAAFAVAVTNNVAADTTIDGSGDAPLEVLPGTDILTVRGVLSGSIYRTRQETTNLTTDTGSVRVESVSPEGVPLPLEPLRQAVDDKLTVPLILVSTLGEVAIVELDWESTVVPEGGEWVEIAFTIGGDGLNWIEAGPLATMLGNAGITKAPVWLDDVPARPIAMVGILEENRYYVRRNFQAASGPLSIAEAQPKLAMARFYAGTNTPFGANAQNLRLDLADDIVDLQVALARDGDLDGNFTDTGADDDEWFFNAAGDVAPDFEVTPFQVVRISTLARSHRRDPNYKAPAITAIEDRAYNETPGFGDPGFAGGDPNPTITGQERLDRLFHRRLLQTVVDLRNL